MENREVFEQLKKANMYIGKHKLVEADYILDKLLKDIEPVEIDKYGRVMDFNNYLEFILYCNMDKHLKTSWTRNFLSEIYLSKAIIEYENKKYKEAVSNCEKALRWNPVSVHIYSELLENYIKLKDYNKFDECFKQAMKIAIRPVDIAMFYKKNAYVWIEKGNDEIAYKFLLYSKLFFPRKEADIEISYLEKKFGARLKYFPDMGTIQYLKEKNMEYERPDYIIPTLMNAVDLMLQIMKKEENQTEQNYLTILDYYYSLYFHRPGRGIHAQLVSMQREYEIKYPPKKEGK